MKFSACFLVALLEPLLSQAIALPDSSAQKSNIAELEDDYNIHTDLNGHSFSNEKSPNDNPLNLEKKDTEAVKNYLSTLAHESQLISLKRCIGYCGPYGCHCSQPLRVCPCNKVGRTCTCP